MTGEMSKSEVTPDAFPLHFAIAEACGGSVHPFDQYQGPYVLTPQNGRLWISTDDGVWGYVWSDRTQSQSSLFPIYATGAETYAVTAARELLP